MTDRNKEEDEAQLFLDAMQGVKRIQHDLADSGSKRLDAAARQTTRQSEPSQNHTPSDENSFLRSGIQTNVLRKLRSGAIPVEAQLDLHGYSSLEAEDKVRQFVAGARATGRQRAVRIIHGKGIGSPGGKSVLKAKTQEWLRQNESVLAFCPAGPGEGGSGALHVLLTKR